MRRGRPSSAATNQCQFAQRARAALTSPPCRRCAQPPPQIGAVRAAWSARRGGVARRGRRRLLVLACRRSPPVGVGVRARPAGRGSIALAPPGIGPRVGATEYGGPGDPGSGTVGASGANLLPAPRQLRRARRDTFQTATAMGGLPYMTPLRITWGGHSAIAYKRDFGLGGGPVDGLPRVIDLWWQFAGALGIPYERRRCGRGRCGSQRPPAPGPATCWPDAVATPSSGGVRRANRSARRLRAGRPPAGPARRRARARAAARRSGGGARGRSRRGQGNHRGRQPDRRQAVPVRRRPRSAAGPGGAHIRLLEQRRAPAVRRAAAAGHYDAASGTLRVFGLAGPGPVGDDLRQRRPRVHVRRRAALGHAQRGRARRTAARGSAGTRSCAARPGSSFVTRWGCDGAGPAAALVGAPASRLAGLVAGCAGRCRLAARAPAPRSGTTSPARGPARRSGGVSLRARPHPRDPTPAPPQTALGGWRTPGRWRSRRSPPPTSTGRDHRVARDARAGGAQRRSGPLGGGAGRRARPPRTTSSGAAAWPTRARSRRSPPCSARADQYAVVTRERTTATNTTAYRGLRPAWHLALATVTRPRGRWVVSGWQPEN